MAIKEYCAFLRVPGLEPHHQIQHLIQDSHGMESLTSLQRCSRCILLPKPNGLIATCSYSHVYVLIYIYIYIYDCVLKLLSLWVVCVWVWLHFLDNIFKWMWAHFLHIFTWFLWRCLWCNGYYRRKWTRRHEFKSWTRLIAYHIALIPLGKVWIQLFLPPAMGK